MSTADGSVLGTTQIQGTAPLHKAMNVVLLAEGFTAAEQDAFNLAADRFASTLLKTAPFDEVVASINVFRVNVESAESGADDPKVSDGGSGTIRRTYFDATFGGTGIQRQLLCDDSTALQVAATAVADFDLVLVMVNSSIYGGSGGSVATFSLHPAANQIAIHESGHTAFGLADEYSVYAGGAETGHDHHPATEPIEPNVTIDANRSTLKWGHAVDSHTPLPTMSNPHCAKEDTRLSPVPTGTVGCFEGADYFHCGAYRPEYDCRMRHHRVPFCRVCQDAIRARIGQLTLGPDEL